MQIFWAGALLFAGLVVAGPGHHHRHDQLDYGGSEEGQVSTIDYDPHRSDLKEVVTSLKDLKKCLCKLISVQKKQIELELTHKEQPANIPILDPGQNINVMQSGPAIYSKDDNTTSTSVPTTTQSPRINEPNGVIMENIVATTPSQTTENTPKPVNNNDKRRKRNSRHSKTASSFVQIDPDDLETLVGTGFSFDEDKEAERLFIAETMKGEEGSHSINVGPKTVVNDRKARDTETEKEAEAEPEDKIESRTTEPEEPSSLESPTLPEHLTVNYNRMEKKKAMPTVSLPRKKSMEFPNGGTYYGGGEQEPVEFTLDLPQQTYYLVPGPGGKNKLVRAPQGTYSPTPDDQNPSTSLEARYAPSITDQDWPAEGNGNHQMVMAHGGYNPYAEAEEEQTEPPKPSKKRRKNRKQNKQQANVTTTTTTTTEEAITEDSSLPEES